jgi:hypothetical protein
MSINRTACLKNVNNCWNTNIYSYLETSSGQIYNLYLNVVHFLTPVLIRHLWQLVTVVFLHWCLLCACLLFMHVILMTFNVILESVILLNVVAPDRQLKC